MKILYTQLQVTRPCESKGPSLTHLLMCYPPEHASEQTSSESSMPQATLDCHLPVPLSYQRKFHQCFKRVGIFSSMPTAKLQAHFATATATASCSGGYSLASGTSARCYYPMTALIDRQHDFSRTMNETDNQYVTRPRVRWVKSWRSGRFTPRRHVYSLSILLSIFCKG